MTPADLPAVRARLESLIATADRDAVQDIAEVLESLTDLVHARLGYFEHDPGALIAAGADRIVAVDRSTLTPAESTHPLEQWRSAVGPKLLADVLRRWAERGGWVRLSGSAISGRGTWSSPTGEHCGVAWYAASEDGAVWP